MKLSFVVWLFGATATTFRHDSAAASRSFLPNASTIP